MYARDFFDVGKKIYDTTSKERLDLIATPYIEM